VQDETLDTPASARHKRGCNCKKSLCLKKYCECFQVLTVILTLVSNSSCGVKSSVIQRLSGMLVVDRLASGVQRDAAVRVARMCTAGRKVRIAQWNVYSLCLLHRMIIEEVSRPIPVIALL